MNRLFLTTKSIICPWFLKGLALPSASLNAGALILKRIGIRCYWLVVRLNWISVTVLFAVFRMIPCLCQVKTIFLPTEKQLTPEACAPLIATLPLEVSILTLPLCLSVSCVFAWELVSCWWKSENVTAWFGCDVFSVVWF